MAVNIGPRIGIDGYAEYRKQIYQIIQETKTLKSEYENVATSVDKSSNSLKKNAEHYRILSEEIKKQSERVEVLAKATKESTEKLGETDSNTLKWKEALNQANTELNKMKAELESLPNNIELLGNKMEAAGNKIKAAGNNISAMGRALTPVSAAAAGALAGSAKAAIDFETAMTGVKKTNDELLDSNGNIIISYDDLADSIKKMATETASGKEEIAGVMEAAGQLGVGTEYLSDFTKTMIMLGDSTNMAADEAASAIAKFANVTGMSLDDTDKFGSVIVELGNNFATTEQDIMNMATRLSGAAHQIGLTESETLGFATALSSVGIEAEMGGSAFSKAMIKMQIATESGYEGFNKLQKKMQEVGREDLANMTFREMQVLLANDSEELTGVANLMGMTKKELTSMMNSRADLESFAETASMSAEEFVKAYRDDAPSALQAFISGLGDVEGHGETTIQMLQDMGFTEVRLRDTLTRLASSGDLVTRAIDSGNQAWKENTALVEEASKKYATTEARISQTKERLSNLGIDIGERLLPYLEKGIGYVEKLVTAWDQLDQKQQDTIIAIGAITAAAAPVLVGVGKVVSGLGSIVSVGGKLISFIGQFTPAASSFAGSLSGLLAPIGAAVAAVGVLAGAFVTAYKNNSEFAEKMNSVWKGIKDRFDAFAAKASASWESIKQSVTELLPVIKKVWEMFSEFMIPFFETAAQTASDLFDNLTTRLEGFMDIISGFYGRDFEKIFNGIGEVVESAFDNTIDIAENSLNLLGDIVRKFAPEFPEIKLPHWDDVTAKAVEIKDNVVNAFENVKEKVTGALEAVRTFFENTWEAIKSNPIVQTITDGIVQNFTNAKNTLSAVWENMKASAEAAWETIKNVVLGYVLLMTDLATGDLDQFKSDLTNIWNNIKNSVTTIWKSTTDSIKTLASNAAETTKNIWNTTRSVVTQVWESMQASASSKWQNIKDTISRKSQEISNAVKTTFENIKGFLTNLATSALQWGEDLISNFINGIKSAPEKLRNAITGVAQDIRDRLGFSEPKKGPLADFHTFAPDMMELFAKGIRDNIGLVTDQIDKSFAFSIGNGMGYTGATNNSMTVGGTTINVYAQPGQDAEDIADKVGEILNTRFVNLQEAWA